MKEMCKDIIIPYSEICVSRHGKLIPLDITRFRDRNDIYSPTKVMYKGTGSMDFECVYRVWYELDMYCDPDYDW